MKLFQKIIAIITALLLASTLICGLWIKTNRVSEISSLNFHMNIGIISVIFGFITIVLLLKTSKK